MKREELIKEMEKHLEEFDNPDATLPKSLFYVKESLKHHKYIFDKEAMHMFMWGMLWTSLVMGSLSSLVISLLSKF